MEVLVRLVRRGVGRDRDSLSGVFWEEGGDLRMKERWYLGQDLRTLFESMVER